MRKILTFSLHQALILKPLKVAPATPLTEVVHLMSKGSGYCHVPARTTSNPKPPPIFPAEQPTSCVLIIDDEQLVGILTEKDIVRWIATNRTFDGRTAGEIMVHPVRTLSAEGGLDVLSALTLMRRHEIHHIPIIDAQGQVSGLLTSNRLRTLMEPADFMRFRFVQEVMNTEVIHALPTDSVLHIAQQLTQHRVSCVVIVAAKDEHPTRLAPIGIVTEQDIVQIQRLDLDLERTRAQDVMSTPLFLMSPQDSLWNVDKTMRSHKVRRLVVADHQGDLSGIVTQGNLLPSNPVELYEMLGLLQEQISQLEIEQSTLLEQRNQELELLVNERTSRLQRRDQMLRNLALSVGVKTGEHFWRSLVSYLTEALQLDYALVGQLREDNRIETLAVQGDGEAIPNFAYELQRMPGEQVIAQQSCIHHQGWWKPFPHDPLRQDIQLEGYLGVPLRNTTGQIVGLLAVLNHQPITEMDFMEEVLDIFAARASAELERQEMETEQESFFALSLDLFSIAGLDGYFKKVNPAFKLILGYSPADLLGKPFLDFVHPDDKAATLQATEQLAKGINILAFENRYRCQDGSYRWFLWSATAVPEQKLIYATAHDITERMQAEVVQQESQRRVQEQAALLDVATDAILVRSLDECILFWNKGAETLYGWTREEALEQNANQFLYGNGFDDYEKVYQSLMHQGSWQGERQQVTKAGTVITVVTRWTLVKNEQGYPSSILTVNTDVTEAKQLERQFLRAQRLESIGTLASGIAHDLNNILTPIYAVAQLLPLQLPDLDEHIQQQLKILQKSAQRGSEIVNQVLLFARGEDDELTPLAINHLLTEIRNFATKTFPQHLEISVEEHNDLLLVNGDATKLYQVLMNLMINARDAMPDGGRLSLSATNLTLDEIFVAGHVEAQLGPHVLITVADTGMGIPPEQLDHIFDPFFSTKQAQGGSGLGLSTVHGIVKGHAGFITVYSQVGIGTQFKVYLPALESANTKQEEILVFPSGQGECVLVVDDDALICEVAQYVLESYNYQVRVAVDGIDAIAQYAEFKDDIKIVLMDMTLPKLDGATAIQVMEKLNPQLKVIAISGLPGNEQIASATGQSVKAFIQKPYSSATLLNTLQDVLQAG